jgi:DNA-binding beta-propeller fold protein YncE
VSHSHIDPDADPCRRAWLACPNCDHGAGCLECQSKRNCATHWQYLLRNAASLVVLQCPTCYCVWMVDTAEGNRQAPTVVSASRGNSAGNATRGPTPAAAATRHPANDGDDGRPDAVLARVWLGECPRDIVTSPSGELVYVMTADSVKAVNNFHHIVASIPIGAEPKQMMMSADGSHIYVTGYDGGLSIIDPIGMAVKTVVKQRHTAAAVSPDGEYIYLAHGAAVADGGSGWVTAVRADGIAVAFAAVDGLTTGMALSPNGRRLYVAAVTNSVESRGGTVVVLDTASLNAVDSVAFDADPDTITVDTEGLLYVTHFHANCVSVVDPGTHCVIAVALDDAPLEVVARPGTEFVYATNAHSVAVIDTTTSASTNMMVGELPRRLGISADGRWLYATDFAHGSLWCLDTSQNSVVTTVPVCAHPAAVKLSPDGQFVYVTDSRDGTLTVVSTASLKPNSPDRA